MQKLMLFIVVTFIGFSSCAAQLSSKHIREDSAFRRVKEKDIQRIIEVAEENICNLSWLEGPEWENFVTGLQSEEMSNLPLDEFLRRFNQQVEGLPFTHLYLRLIGRKGTDSSSSQRPEAPFELEAVNAQTALLTIRSFAADAPAMINLVQKIQSDGYENLIIDLRQNTGGTLDAAVVLGRFLTKEPIDAGVYLTRMWFSNHEGYPKAEDIQQFPFLQDMSYEGIMKAFAEKEAFRMVLPAHSDPVFEGKVAVLISNLTASACEPFVDLLNKKDKATIIVRKTAGAILSGAYFDISKDLKLFLPISDYLTAEGTRIDKVGVSPHVSVKSEEALDYVLQNLF